MIYNKTPLRYPGGKQRLTPFIQQIILENNIQNGNYVEPYAGGAGVALELLLSKKVENVHLNDANYGIYAFWYSMLNHNAEFCDLIRTACLTVDEWRRQQGIVKNPWGYSILEAGFSTFFLNRCNRSGIISGGLIGGLNQEGQWKMDARFPRNELIKRIEAINIYRHQIFISNLDAEQYIDNYIPNLALDNTIVYLDPPYYEKASNLYLNSYSKQDHSRIAKKIQSSINHKWVLSYDAAPQILSLYEDKRSFLYSLQYNAGKAYKGHEVFVFSDNLAIPRSCKLSNIDYALEQFYA